MFLHLFAADPDNPPQRRRERGFVNNGFSLGMDAAFFDGKCIARSLLPDYPIARIRMGQDATESGVKEWRVDIGLAARAAAQAAYNSIAAGDYGAPAAQSRFDLYLSGDTLIYLKAPCVEGVRTRAFSCTSSLLTLRICRRTGASSATPTLTSGSSTTAPTSAAYAWACASIPDTR